MRVKIVSTLFLPLLLIAPLACGKNGNSGSSSGGAKITSDQRVGQGKQNETAATNPKSIASKMKH